MKARIRKTIVAFVLLFGIGLIVYSLAPTILGYAAASRGHDDNIELEISVRPKNNAQLGDTITLSAEAKRRLVAVKFTVTNGACSIPVRLDSRRPFVAKFTPTTELCGEGTYTIKARAVSLAGRQQTVTKSITVSSEDSPEPITVGSVQPVTTSSDVFPPVASFGPEQILSTVTLGALPENTQYTITGSLTGSKGSGGTFDLEYRLVTGSGAILVQRTIVDPMQTIDSFTAALTVPANTAETVQLEFRSKESFSAVTIDSWSMQIVQS